MIKNFIFLCFMIIVSNQAFSQNIPGMVLGNGINIRSGNGTQFDVIYKGRTGDIFPVISIEDNGWFKIQLPSKINGYIRKDFITFKKNGSFPMTVEVNASRVNVRIGPNRDSRWITRFYNGDKLRAYSESDGWINIQYPNPRIGYIISKYFDLVDSRKGYVTADCVNIRNGPGIDRTIVAKLYYECPIIYLDEKDNWYKIKIRGGPIGWIFKDFAKFKFKANKSKNIEKEKRNITPKFNNNVIDKKNISEDGFKDLNFNE